MNGIYSHDDADMQSYVFARSSGNKRLKGIVSSYISCLKAGYIDGEDGVRYFVQGNDISSLKGTVVVGTQVTFLPSGVEGKRPHAGEVRLASRKEEYMDEDHGTDISAETGGTR